MRNGPAIAASDRGLWSWFFRGDKGSAFKDDAARFAAGRFGMWLLIVTLAIVFFATILAYIIVRLSPQNRADWPPVEMPGLPTLFVWSTMALVASSGTMHVATVAAKGSERTAGGWMLATLALALLFLALQVVAWVEAARENMDFQAHLYAWTFYVLTALHAIHIAGGVGPMARTTVQAFRGRYDATNHRGIVYCAMYWHFLDVVWLILYVTLLWGSMR